MNMLGAVRWAIAAFMADPQLDDDELVDVLETAGVPHGSELVMFLPLAFGRQILEGLVACPDTFVELDESGVSHESRLLDEPVYAAAREVARSASRAQIERIGFRSSEVHAVNQALTKGSKPEDLVMGPPHMPRLARKAGSLHEAQPIVDELVRRHAVSLPLETRTFPGSLKKGAAQLQLDVVAKIGNREIVESFAGWGATVGAAVDQAIDKFARASLHVLLATLVAEEHGTDQVTWETCGKFRVCSGALARMWSNEPPLDYSKLFDAICERLAAANLSRELHWFRIFVGISENKIVGLDALLDNEPWPPGVDLTQGWSWPPSDRGYAIRHFFTLIPLEG
jgi:hypothetical protein